MTTAAALGAGGLIPMNARCFWAGDGFKQRTGGASGPARARVRSLPTRMPARTHKGSSQHTTARMPPTRAPPSSNPSFLSPTP